MDSSQKHFIGYWMTIIGFAFLVAGGIFSSYLELDPNSRMISAAVSFMIFLLGAELSHRNNESGSESS